MSRPSTYVFFVSYICLLIVAVALGTFLPIILNSVRPTNCKLMVMINSADTKSFLNFPLEHPIFTRHPSISLQLACTLCGHGIRTLPAIACGIICCRCFAPCRALQFGLTLQAGETLAVSSRLPCMVSDFWATWSLLPSLRLLATDRPLCTALLSKQSEEQQQSQLYQSPVSLARR
jgi:hypothetical protein